LINIFAAKENLPSMKIEEYRIDDGQYFINAKNVQHSYKIWIDNTTGRISKLSHHNNEQILLIREYGDFTSVENSYFPRKIKMVRPEEKQAVSVFYTNLVINQDIDRDNFIINISDNAEQMIFSR
jgi:hypothetical protein